jgi:hypothetical protein
MKTLNKIVIVNTIIIAIVALTSFIWTSSATKKVIEPPTNGKSFVVLELFTSEGCSSCPPAEELLAKIDRESNGKPVYVLGYHVDYFDNLGWRDVFGSQENTRRQQRYSSWLNSQVYTPQLVVNGTEEFIGSDEPKISNAINEQLLVKHVADLSLSSQQDDKVITVKYEAKDIQAGEDLLLALVQKNGHTDVKRGENEGRSLSHIQIVRKTALVSLKGAHSGTATLSYPKEAGKQAWEVIGMIQHTKTGVISAATKIAVNP